MIESDYDRAVSAINRLIGHLDKAKPVSVISESGGEAHDVHDWLVFHCFGDDHELYDDLMCLPGVRKSWAR